MPMPEAHGLGEWLMRIREAIFELLFPTRCIGCRRPGTPLCEDCLQAIEHIPPSVCSLCGTSARGSPASPCHICAERSSYLAGSRSIGYATGILREAIHQLKYRGHAHIAEPLALCLSHWWEANPLPIDVVMPIPLHPRRERERGYNQAALLSRRFSLLTGLLHREDVLIRVRDTRPQVGLTAQERRMNVAGAFRCETQAVTGRRILLMDDVMTTGATLEAAAQALRDAGAASVWALTVGRAKPASEG